MKKVFLALILASAVVFNACGFFDKGPDKDPKEVVKEAMKKVHEVKSGDYDFSFDAEISTKEESLGFKKIEAAGSFKGVYDVNDLNNAMFTVVMELSGSRDDAKKDESVKGEMRFSGNMAYMVLNEITDFEGNIPPLFVEPFKGQWYSMPLPKEVMDTALISYKDDSALTEQEKQLKALTENADMFKDIKYEGTEKIGDGETYKYSLGFDKEAFKKYLKEYAKLSGEEVVTPNEAQLNEAMEKMTFSDGFIWVGKDDMTMKKISGNLVITDLEGVDLDVNFSAMGNPGGAVKVEIPKDAKEFDPIGMMTGGSGVPVDGGLTGEDLPPDYVLDATGEAEKGG